MNFKSSMLTGQLIEATLQQFTLCSESSDSLIAILLDFLHPNDLSFVVLRLFEQVIIALLRLFALHGVLFLKLAALPETQL